MKTSEGIAQLIAALAEAQCEIQNPKKDRTAKITSQKGNYEYQYADLASVLEAVRPALSKHGIAIVQMPHVSAPTERGKDAEGNHIRVASLTMTTRLMHKSGEWIEHELSYEIDPDDRVQALGSAITYLRRYALQAIVGIVAEEDDDGHAGGVQTKQRQEPPQQRQQHQAEQRQAPAPPPAQQPPVKASPAAAPRAAAAAATVNDAAKLKEELTLEYGALQKGAGKPPALLFWQHWKNEPERLGAIKRANAAIKAINSRLGAAGGADQLLSSILLDREKRDDVVGILADLEKAAGIDEAPY